MSLVGGITRLLVYIALNIHFLNISHASSSFSPLYLPLQPTSPFESNSSIRKAASSLVFHVIPISSTKQEGIAHTLSEAGMSLMNLCPITGTFCKVVSSYSPLTPSPCHPISRNVPRGYPCAQSAPRRRRRARRSRQSRRTRQASCHYLPSVCPSQTPRLISISYSHPGRRALIPISDRGETHSLVVALTVHPPMFGWILYLRPVSPPFLPLSASPS